MYFILWVENAEKSSFIYLTNMKCKGLQKDIDAIVNAYDGQFIFGVGERILRGHTKHGKKQQQQHKRRYARLMLCQQK